MKYRKNGRTYKTVKFKGCSRCIMRNIDCGPDGGDAPCPARKMWRETLFSKIRNWRRKG